MNIEIWLCFISKSFESVWKVKGGRYLHFASYITMHDSMSPTCSPDLNLSQSNLKICCLLLFTDDQEISENQGQQSTNQNSWRRDREPVRSGKLAAPSLSTTALWDEEKGPLEKELDLPRGKVMRKSRGERRGWITQEEDCLFSTGQTGISSTFTYGDGSALCECEVVSVYICSSAKAGKEYRRQREIICQSTRWLPRCLIGRKTK